MRITKAYRLSTWMLDRDPWKLVVIMISNFTCFCCCLLSSLYRVIACSFPLESRLNSICLWRLRLSCHSISVVGVGVSSGSHRNLSRGASSGNPSGRKHKTYFEWSGKTLKFCMAHKLPDDAMLLVQGPLLGWQGPCSPVCSLQERQKHLSKM